MKEVQVTAWCDGCATEDGGGTMEPSAGEVTVTIGPGRPRVLDLCERHRKALVEPLALLLAESGQDPPETRQTPARTSTRTAGRVGRAPGNPERYPCLWCETTYGTSGGLGAHARRDHGIKDGTVAAIYGTRCPECGDPVKGGSQGFGVHAGTLHGATSVARLFHDVDVAGDPLGVVAARRKRRHK